MDVDLFATALDCDGNIIGSSSATFWTGTISTNWMTPGNWSTGNVPTLNDNVIIPAGTLFSPSINNGVQAVCKTIRVNTGAAISVSTGGDLKAAQ